MPNNNNRLMLWQLGVLLMVVPLQYYLTQRNPMTPSERSYSMQKMISNLGSLKEQVLSVKTWQRWYFDCVDYITMTVMNLTSAGGDQQKGPGSKFSTSGDEDEWEGESPAIEVMQYEAEEGYFAGSPELRSPRPANVKFRVGQVIRHKIHGYRGVIIGWDPVARAPEEWFKQMHDKNKPHWRHGPNYSILVDTRDRPAVQTTYVPEENMEVIRSHKVIHPEIDNYFEHFDGTRYLARPFLKKLYPHDQ